MLRACGRLLKPGGRLAFYTIFIPPGLSDRDYRRALRLDRAAIGSRKREQQELLRSAGFVEISETDVTAEFLRISRAWLEARDRHAAGLRESEGHTQFEQKQAEARGQIEAIEAGLMRRSLLVAERPL